MKAPTLLWQLRGQTGSLTRCTLHDLPTGGVEIRITGAGGILFGERYDTPEEARRHAADYFDSLLERGWRRAA